MYAYLVNYWLPFPSSEYGGLQVVIAASNADCISILEDTVNDREKKMYPDYRQLIETEVIKAKVLHLSTANSYERGILEEFLT